MLKSGGVADKEKHALKEQQLREQISKLQAELNGGALSTAGRAGQDALGPEDARPGQILPEF